MREFIPVPEDPIKCRFASMEKKKMIEMLEMTDSSSIWFDIGGPLKLHTIPRDYYCNEMMKLSRVYGECMSLISRDSNILNSWN